jgi:hypothetical protein
VSQRTQALRDLVETLESLALSIREEIARAAMDVDEALVLGHFLAVTVRRAAGAIEPIKSMLREEALAQDNGAPGPRHFKSPEGHKCVVVVPKPSLSIRKGTNISQLKEDLGKTFDMFFESKVQYKVRKEFDKVASGHDLTPKAMAVIDFTEGTPRVSFKN